MVSGIEAFDVIKPLLLVHIDEHTIIECLPQPGSLDFAWLEHGISVGEDDDGPPLLYVLHRIQSSGIQAVSEWVVDQPARHPQQLRAMQVLEPVALQRSQIIDVSQFAAQLLKNYPVSVASDDPVRLFQVLFKMSLHAIVVDERVVNVEQEDDVRHFAHRTPCLTAFACRELFSDRPKCSG